MRIKIINGIDQLILLMELMEWWFINGIDGMMAY
jgi:hypothetical protein